MTHCHHPVMVPVDLLVAPLAQEPQPVVVSLLVVIVDIVFASAVPVFLVVVPLVAAG